MLDVPINSDRDYSLSAIIDGIASDLDELRSGRISVKDAQVRALLAKQYMNGVRLALTARQHIEDKARPVKSIAAADMPGVA